MSKIKDLIIGQFRMCDIVTMLGTVSATIGIILAMQQHFSMAIFLLIICCICDCVDGTFARKRKNTKFESTYGGELDSLSDMISFGIFPSVIAVSMIHNMFMYLIVVLYVLCGLIRLTYFNTLKITKTGTEGYFVGVPITTISFIYPFIYALSFINSTLYTISTMVLFFVMSILFISKIKIKKPNLDKILNKIKNTELKTWQKIILNFIIFPIFIIFASDLFYKINNFVGYDGFAFFDTFKSFFSHPFAAVYLIIYIDLIMLLLMALFKKSNKAKMILIIIVSILLIVNDFKYAIMGLPIKISDVGFFNSSNMGTAVSVFDSLKGTWIIKSIIKFIIMIISAIILNKSSISKMEIKTLKMRFVYIIISLIMLILISNQTTKYSKIIVEKVYNSNREESLAIKNYAEHYYSIGFFQGIVYNQFSSNLQEPDNYNREEVKNILKNSLKEDDNWGKPNIVIYLSEALTDITELPDITFDKDILSNIHSYEKNDNIISTNTLVSTYGGISVISEWEMITGATNEFLPQGYVAYTQYYLPDNIKNINGSPSVVKALNAEGYITKYVTPWSSKSFNNKKVYTLLGADETIYKVKGEIKGDYLSDYAFTNRILKELRKNPGEPKLIVSASAQNHMPCSTTRYKKNEYDINVVSSNFNQEDTELLRCYAQGAYDADKELARLYEEIQKLDEDTIVLFFGDHLPIIIDSNGNDLYLSSSYMNTGDKDLDYLRKYTTKSVIFSNYDIKLDEKINYINLNYLTAYVMSHLDIQDKDFYTYVNNVRKEIPVFTRDYIYDLSSNEIILNKNLDQKRSQILKEYKDVQYYEFFDKDSE